MLMLTRVDGRDICYGQYLLLLALRGYYEREMKVLNVLLLLQHSITHLSFMPLSINRDGYCQI